MCRTVKGYYTWYHVSKARPSPASVCTLFRRFYRIQVSFYRSCEKVTTTAAPLLERAIYISTLDWVGE